MIFGRAMRKGLPITYDKCSYHNQLEALTQVESTLEGGWKS